MLFHEGALFTLIEKSKVVIYSVSLLSMADGVEFGRVMTWFLRKIGLIIN